MSEKIIIGITQGDINGIGYEIIMKGLSDSRIFEMCTPVVYGSSKVAAYHRKALNINDFSFVTVKNVDSIQNKKPNLINVLDDAIKIELGKNTEEGGKCSVMSLDAAVTDLRCGKIDAIITCPINKSNAQKAGFGFSGHTEYFQTLFNSPEVIMFMISENFRLGVATGHIPISEVTHRLSTELILSKLEIMNKSLLRDFGIIRPVIAVLGLNPHAGEEGMLGSDENEKIIPAINRAREKGIMAIGPYSADGFFGSENHKKFDAVLAMYHDQGLIPFKMLAFAQGINYTAGLPVIRTSPAHGTAFDITGKNVANEQPFLQSLYLAIDIIKNRKHYDEISKNPLQKQAILTDTAPDLYIDQITETDGY